MSVLRVLFSVLLVVCLSSAVVSGQSCSSYLVGDSCSDCSTTVGCGWCSVKMGPSGYANSSCMAGTAAGPSQNGACVGGVWHSGIAPGSNLCGDDCNSQCNLHCGDNTYCSTSPSFVGYSTLYACQCVDNSAAIHWLGMALTYFILLIVFLCLGTCVAIGLCVYCCMRRPTVIQQPLVYTAVAAPQPPRPTWGVTTSPPPFRNSSLSYNAAPAYQSAGAPTMQQPLMGQQYHSDQQ